MSVGYTTVQWSRHKRVYDAIAAGAISLYLALFVVIAKLLWTGEHAISDEIIVIRALGSCTFVLLTVILCIGPLARLDRRFLAVMYNRRHLGVMTFLVALGHAALVVGYYHGFGMLNPLVSMLVSNTNLGRFQAFPFELPGLAALVILFLMAATSHDFWLKNLGSAAWKRLHMLAYVAYGLLVAHIALGAMQGERGTGLTALVWASVVAVSGLHLAAGRAGAPADRSPAAQREPDGTEWIDAGEFDSIPEGRARVVMPARGEAIAIFKHQGALTAVTNVCAHQGGPLGEGKIIDGCITCPWHGWQYKPGDGCSPPPFTEKVPTFQVRVAGSRVQVNSGALPPGTQTTPASPARYPDQNSVIA